MATAVALMGLYPLHQLFGVKRAFFATYQSVSGTGADAIEELEETARLWWLARPEPLSPAQIDELRLHFGARW